MRKINQFITSLRYYMDTKKIIVWNYIIAVSIRNEK